MMNNSDPKIEHCGTPVVIDNNYISLDIVHFRVLFTMMFMIS